jgi:hypothetical protein
MILTRWKKAGAGIALAGTLATGGTALADRAVNPYIDQGTSYELPLHSDIPQGERLEIAKDRPASTLHFWNDEGAITITPQVPRSAKLGAAAKATFSTASRPLLSKRMEFKAGDTTAFVQPKDDDPATFDIDFTLDAKPDTNVFTYQIDGAEDFDFFYQPPLDEEMASSTCTPTDCSGAHRDENVVGSYAVYSKTKANHVVGETNYATGKVMHIYRPKATDANGNEVWAALAYENGTLSVTVPQEFLDSAAYPVTIDPTFGYTTKGASEGQVWENRVALGHYLTNVTESGTVIAISFWLRANASGGVARTALYTVSNQSIVPNSESSELSFGTSDTLQTYSYSGTQPTISAQDYYIALWSNSVPSFLKLRYDATGSFGDNYYNETAYSATNSFPSPLSSNQSRAEHISIYATYTAAPPPASAPDDGLIIFQ